MPAALRPFLLALACTVALTAAAADDPVVSGTLLRATDGGLRFEPCDGPAELPVDDVGADADLAGLYAVLADNATPGLRADLRGRVEGGRFIASGIERLVRHGSVCRQMRKRPAVFRALGHTPSWSLNVDRVRLRLQLGGSRDTPEFRYRRFARDPQSGRRVYDVRETSSSLRVTLLPERCMDGLAYGIYSYRAIVVYDGRVLRGCAYAGTLPE